LKQQITARSLRHGHQLQHVAVRVLEVKAAAAAPVVELAVLQAPGRAALGETRLLHAAEDRIELAIAHMKRVMVALELAVVVAMRRRSLSFPSGRMIPLSR
jgi:hypothetical protein